MKSPRRFKTSPIPAIARVRESLLRLAEGKGGWETFSVSYDDLHPLQGGLTLTISGTGKVEQAAERETVGETKLVSTDDLRVLVKLLVELEAWRQLVPERRPHHDESRADLEVRVGDSETRIWEWYNDLGKQPRILRIREAMKRAAWTSIPG